MSKQDNHALALKLALEWQETISCLYGSVVDDAEVVTILELKPEIAVHPFYAGKISLLRTFKDLADADVDRYKVEGQTMLDELEAWRLLSKDLLDYFVHIHARHFGDGSVTCDCDGCTLYVRIKEAIDLRTR